MRSLAPPSPPAAIAASNSSVVKQSWWQMKWGKRDFPSFLPPTTTALEKKHHLRRLRRHRYLLPFQVAIEMVLYVVMKHLLQEWYNKADWDYCKGSGRCSDNGEYWGVYWTNKSTGCVHIRRNQWVFHGSHLRGCSGGVQTLGLETDTIEGEAKLTTALAETATIEQSGQRTIGPFDCSGMTGHSCCLMIKHKVRDSDSKGRAIQCYQDYHQSTEKHKVSIIRHSFDIDLLCQIIHLNLAIKLLSYSLLHS